MRHTNGEKSLLHENQNEAKMLILDSGNTECENFEKNKFASNVKSVSS